MTTRTGCTQTLLSSDYIFFFHQRNRVFDCLLFGQAALVFSEFIFNRMRPKKISFLWTSNPANRTQISCLKIVTFSHIVPLIFKFVDLKSGQPNSNFSFENRHFLSHRPPNFLNHFLEISARILQPPEKFV